MITERQIAEAHRLAVVQKGPRKGFLKHQCPPKGTLAAAYWNGIAAATCSHKTGLGHRRSFTPEQWLMYHAAKVSAIAVAMKRKYEQAPSGWEFAET